MGFVNNEKLEAIANYIGEMEMYGDCVCYNFNDSLKENRIDVPCHVGDCEGDCPFYSKENFLNWIKKPYRKEKIMENNHTTPNEMTNAEFMEKIKQECENDEELKEAVNEITGIFLRAIIESLKE